MPQRKKQFPCGHKGNGLFCHRCDQEAKNAKRREERRMEEDRERTRHGLDMEGLPLDVVKRANDVMDELSVTGNWWALQGERRHDDRILIRIPVGKYYRLLCREMDSGKIQPRRIVTHEEYNNLKSW